MTAELEVDSQNGGIVVNSELQARSDLYGNILYISSFSQLVY